MRRFHTTCLLLALAMWPRVGIAADGAAIDAATRAALQQAISGQIEALNRDDGEKAESFAAAGIRQKFPNGPAFMAMVRAHYAALLHPKSTRFGTVDASPHGPLQTVTVVAADGTIWTAIYSFEQADGAWRITGCSLQKLEGQQEI